MSIEKRPSTIVQEVVLELPLGVEHVASTVRRSSLAVRGNVQSGSYGLILGQMNCIYLDTTEGQNKITRTHDPGEICKGCFFNVPKRTKIIQTEPCNYVPEEYKVVSLQQESL